MMKYFTKIKSIQKKYLVSLLPLLTIMFFIVGYIVYKNVASKNKSMIEEFSMQIIDSRSDEVSGWILSLTHELLRVAENDRLQSMKWDQIESYLLDIANKRKDDFGLIFIIYPDGTYFVPGKGKQDKKLNERSYFKDIMNEKKEYSVSEPSLSKSTGEKKFNIAVPIKNDKNEVVGCLALNVLLTRISGIVEGIKVKRSGYGYFVDSSGFIVAHPNAKYPMQLNLLTSADSGFVGYDELAKKMILQQKGTSIAYNKDGTEELLIYTPIDNTPGWSLGVAVPTTEIYKEVDDFLIFIFILFVGILVIVSLLVAFMSRFMIVNPIRLLIKFTENVASGRLYNKIEYASHDEIGIMAHSLQVMNDKLKNVVETIRDGASNIDAGSKEISDTSETIATGANEQAASTEQISASIEEVADIITRNFEEAKRTETVALEVWSEIENIVLSSEESLSIVKEISNKIKIIHEISEKTDNLAINAAIVAARAGESGKGFTVVANEIRKLAERSQQAAVEIDVFSIDSVRKTQQAKDLLLTLKPKVQENAAMIKDIAASSEFQSNSIAQIKNAILELANVTQSNSAASEELAASASELSSQSENLFDIISYFKMGAENLTVEISEVSNQIEQLKKMLQELEHSKNIN